MNKKKREELYKYWGVDYKVDRPRHLTKEQIELAKYCQEGVGIDCGCGSTKCDPNCIGVDIHHESAAEIKTDCRFLKMFKDNQLDFVVSSHTLEHMPDFISVLKEWKRVLRVGGKLCIAVPNGHKYPKFICRNGHKTNLGIEELRLVFKFILKMKVIEMKLISNNKGIDRVIFIVGEKRDN